MSVSDHVLDEVELAWAAGFFDGEGSTTVKKNQNGSCYVRVSIANTDLLNIERFCDAVGMPRRIYSWQYKNNKWKTRYSVDFGAMEDVQRILFNLWPYLGIEKRIQAGLCINTVRKQPVKRIGAYDYPLMRYVNCVPGEVANRVAA